MGARVGPVRVERGGRGRPSKVERKIVDELVLTAETMRDWQIRNKRIATGKSASSYRVVISRPNNRFKQKFGIVEGKITAAPHTKFALEGRKKGGFPPVPAIEAWIETKRIKSKKWTKKQLAWLIARKIATQGTNPPHFTEKVRTKIVKGSTLKMLTTIKEPLAEAMGKDYVRLLMKVAKEAENIGYQSTSSGTQFNYKNFMTFSSRTVTDDGDTNN